MADGQEFQIRRGDRVLLFPLISPQMDPEVHQEPQVGTPRLLRPHGREVEQKQALI